MERVEKISRFTSKAVPFFGMYFRGMVGIPLLGRTVAPMNKIVGGLLPRFSTLGFRKEASFENAVWNYQVFLKLIGAPHNVDTSIPYARSFIIYKCPAGHCQLGHLDACLATMELNSSLVETSGARLVVEKRFPVNGVCIEKVVPIK
jgi:hypothetical protein